MNSFHRWYCASRRWTQKVEKSLLPWVVKGVDLGPNVLEVGPGPGVTTKVLRRTVRNLTALEVDGRLARALQTKLADSNVVVVHGDGTQMPFDDATFSGAVCCTMLHHVPSANLQDGLLKEVFRVLRPGAWFAGSDSRSGVLFRVAHLFDTMVLVDPAGFAGRMEAAGFSNVKVDVAPGAFRFRGRRPDDVERQLIPQAEGS